MRPSAAETPRRSSSTSARNHPPVAAFLGIATEEALGIALRRKYDFPEYRNGGYVWVANFSKETRRIKHALLHEVGHVLGMPHDSVFVMDSNTAPNLLNTRRFASEHFGVIESESWRYDLQPGDVVPFTHYGGFKRRNAPQACLLDGAMPNEALPQVVRRAANLPDRGCHRLSLRIESIGADKRRFEASLLVEGLGGRQRSSFTGTFHSSRVASMASAAPGLYGPWRTADGRTVVRRRTLGTARQRLPALGSFSASGTLPLAARIENDRGISIELFLPESGRWWEARNPSADDD